MWSVDPSVENMEINYFELNIVQYEKIEKSDYKYL